MATDGAAAAHLAEPVPLSHVAGATEYWDQLWLAAQAALVRAKLNASSAFCYAFDGSVEDVDEFVVASGGVARDIQPLLHIREACWVTARSEVRRVACMPVPLAVAAAFKGERKRSQAELGLPTHMDLSHTDCSQQGTSTTPRSWPAQIRRSMRLLNDLHIRAKAEESHRARWIAEVRAFYHRSAVAGFRPCHDCTLSLLLCLSC